MKDEGLLQEETTVEVVLRRATYQGVKSGERGTYILFKRDSPLGVVSGEQSTRE